MTKDTPFVCHAVGVYTNDECVGLPITVIPLFAGQNEAKAPCISEHYFGKHVSVKLFCEGEGEGHDHETEHGDDDHEADEGDEEGVEGVEDRAMQAPKGMGGRFDSLHL
ncbi:hypothetical protein BDW66DRAFT_150178 [Aspergillus desertorum]